MTLANTATSRIGARMRETRDERLVTTHGAAAQARVGVATWEAVEEFGPVACTEITLRRILDWLEL